MAWALSGGRTGLVIRIDICERISCRKSLTNMMIADVFTKAVEEEIFHRCKHALRNTNRESYITRKISRLTAALARARAESAATEQLCGPEGALAPGHRRSRM